MTGTIDYRDTWPSLDRLWTMRHESLGRVGFHATQRICVTCSHVYTPGRYRDHLRSDAHRTNRGWWRS